MSYLFTLQAPDVERCNTHSTDRHTLLLFISPIIPTPIIISYTQAATEISYLLEKIHKTVIELL